ncbi:MAG TPA: ATP-binding protein, partial [Pedobacter sp.]
MKTKQTSFIIVVIIIALCLIVLLKISYKQYAEQKILRATNIEMEANKNQISKLDTINLGLQEAENNFRMYTSLWKKEYFNNYNNGIRHISVLLESFSKKELKDISSNISTDLAKKNKQVLLYMNIKKLTDSLMSVNLSVDTNENVPAPAVIKPYLPKVLKKVTKVEEVKTTASPKKKKFFQRLKSAILNKESKDSIKTRKVETTYEENHGKDAVYTRKQLREIERFYQNLLENQRGNHKQLTDQEQAILKLNQQIFYNIKLMFNEFSTRERGMELARRSVLRNRNLHALKMIDQSGKINFILNVLFIIIAIFLLSKLYSAYNKILKANKLAAEQVIVKSRFFTSISHEMRTPLNAILGVTEQLKNTPLNDTQEGMTSLLETSSSMLLSAVNEILEFSRLETGKLSLSKTPFHYKNILNDVVAATTVLAEQKGLELTLNLLNTPDILLTGDPYRLKQIVINLIANAVKFTDQGKIDVEVNLKYTDENHALLVVRVSDTGVGIAEKDLPFIFDEFSQVINSKRTDWQKGSGLGLPICKKLVEIHGGKISVTSTVGKGSVFSIEIPYSIAQKDTENDIITGAADLQTEAFKNIHLLVVDDAKMNLLVIEMIFRKLNISFDTATNG